LHLIDLASQLKPKLDSVEGCAAKQRLSSVRRGQAVLARITALVTDLIGRVADKWTMLLLEVLTEHGELRFTALAGC
jgi:hypothetical protein